MADYRILPLYESTWPDFAALVESNGGVWGGCWCMGFHPEGFRSPVRENKHARVCEGRAHAALVFEGDQCIGWCQYGSPEEVSRIKHRKAYEAGLDALPDWRITCFYVGKGHRGKGVAKAALDGALKLIAESGGGVVESSPEDVTGRKTSSSFLHNGTLAMFEAAGFTRVRQLGKNHWLVRRTVG